VVEQAVVSMVVVEDSAVAAVTQVVVDLVVAEAVVTQPVEVAAVVVTRATNSWTLDLAFNLKSEPVRTFTGFRFNRFFCHSEDCDRAPCNCR